MGVCVCGGVIPTSEGAMEGEGGGERETKRNRNTRTNLTYRAERHRNIKEKEDKSAGREISPRPTFYTTGSLDLFYCIRRHL